MRFDRGLGPLVEPTREARRRGAALTARHRLGVGDDVPPQSAGHPPADEPGWTRHFGPAVLPPLAPAARPPRAMTPENMSLIRRFLSDSQAARLREGELKDDSPLFDFGALDSLNIIELVLFLEDTFGIKTRAHEIVAANFGTIEALVRFVESK